MSDDLKERLLPCPFCSGEPAILEARENDSFIRGYSICCDECGIEMSDEYKDIVSANWNRRAPHPLSARIEALEAQLVEAEGEAVTLKICVDRLAAQLAEAREALEEIVAAIHPSQGGTQGAIRKRAVAALPKDPSTGSAVTGCKYGWDCPKPSECEGGCAHPSTGSGS